MSSLFDAIYQALSGTPWWVYVLFFYLLNIGIEASKPSVVPMWKMAVLPVLFTWLSFHSLIHVLTINVLTMSLLLLGLAGGAFIGWQLFCRHEVMVDKKNWLLQLPGSWLPLSMILLIFVVKYYFGYQLAVDPQRLYQTGFELFMLLVSSLCAGLFIGRFGFYLYRFKTGPFASLKIES